MIKNTIRALNVFILLITINGCIIAQNEPLTKEYKRNAIESLATLMNNHYVFPEVAKKTEEHLIKEFESGHFDEFKDNDSFASALTIAVQSINHDKHMRIWKNKPYAAPENSPERTIEQMIDQMNWSRRNNLGFKKAEILEGNVGYLDLRGFAGLESAATIADAYMNLLSRSDAIIIDLSKNGGGSPRMVQYLCSYFFEDKVHLNSLYWRESNETEEFWTLDEVGGQKLPDIPLFVMTSAKTFSGAEEFSYNMQTRKRATLVGQTTGGGANPGGSMPVNENLSVFIPTGRAINPVTNTNWEGIGVIPDVQVGIEESFEKTYQFALEAAEEYRADKKHRFTTHYLELDRLLNELPDKTREDGVRLHLDICLKEKVLDEDRINRLGYQFLLESNKPEIALFLFEQNINLFPASANTYDSYAEALMATGDLEKSLIQYKKAVSVAQKNKDTNLEFYKENLRSLEQKIKKAKP